MASKRLIDCPKCMRHRPYGAHGICNTCNSTAWAKANPDWRREQARKGAKRRRAANPEKFRLLDRARHAANPALKCATSQRHREKLSWAQRALYGDKRRGRTELSLVWLEQLRIETVVCGCCARPLDYSFHKLGDFSKRFATLDKIVPDKGYVESNIAIICLECNRLKDRMTLSDARMVVAYIESHVEAV